MAVPTTKVTRDYSDNISVKDAIVNDIVPAYFDDIDASLRNVGVIGYTAEQMSNISEDSFNTVSVLFREAFPNRAQIPESIYSHAALFHIDETFSTASTCHFLLVIKEENVIQNILAKVEAGDEDAYDKDTGIYHFYIGRETIIYVEDRPFTLDYPVRVSAVKRTSSKGDEYLFTARYMLDDIYRNSLSDINDPNIKVRRNDNGYIALDLQFHQCLRDPRTDQIVSNSVVNYPSLEFTFEGKLAGFDVFYKSPDDDDFNTPMDKLLVYSQPLTTPFCYYQMIASNKIRITFNTKDNFYKPEFNSELKVIFYQTLGKDGEFPSYDGTDISLIPDYESYNYTFKYLVAAKPLGASEGGQDQMDMDGVQSLAVEGYRTALALTTEDDLLNYFSNYKYRYGNSDILFIRKRDDVYERLYAAYNLLRDGDYIYNTNTLNLKLNLSDMKNPEKNIYMMDPGYLFTANDANGYAEIYRDPEKTIQYYAEYLVAVKEGTIPFIDDPVLEEDIPPYLRRPASFAEFKARHNLEDKVMVFDASVEEYQVYDDHEANKFLLINPFLIRFKKNPNLVSAYLTCIDKEYLLDFYSEGNNESSFIHFITYSIRVTRKFAKEKKYTVSMKLGASVYVKDDYPLIDVIRDQYGAIEEYILGDKYNVENNDVRVLLVLKNNGAQSCYTELYPTNYDDTTRNITFEGEFYTDDHITSANKLRLLERKQFRYTKDSEYYGRYYMVQDIDKTMYDLYNEDDEIIATDIPVDIVTQMYNAGVLYTWSNVVNMSNASDILVPMDDVECEVHIIYKRIYSETTGDLVPVEPSPANNIFTQFAYGESYKPYLWINEYITGTYPITLMRVLDNVRIMLTFEDYTEAYKEVDEEGVEQTKFTHDIFDVQMRSIPFMRWNVVHDEVKLDTFFRNFYAEYNFLCEIIRTRIRNATILDVKFYNTYGRSRNFHIGEDNEVINSVNISMEMDIWYLPGTELIPAAEQIKRFIKKSVESINEIGQNNIFISNLMRKIETNFDYVDHIRFVKINDYASEYQAVKNYTADLTTLTVLERRDYVPEFLVIDLDDITINGYYADDNSYYLT